MVSTNQKQGQTYILGADVVVILLCTAATMPAHRWEALEIETEHELVAFARGFDKLRGGVWNQKTWVPRTNMNQRTNCHMAVPVRESGTVLSYEIRAIEQEDIEFDDLSSRYTEEHPLRNTASRGGCYYTVFLDDSRVSFMKTADGWLFWEDFPAEIREYEDSYVPPKGWDDFDLQTPESDDPDDKDLRYYRMPYWWMPKLLMEWPVAVPPSPGPRRLEDIAMTRLMTPADPGTSAFTPREMRDWVDLYLSPAVSSAWDVISLQWQRTWDSILAEAYGNNRAMEWNDTPAVAIDSDHEHRTTRDYLPTPWNNVGDTGHAVAYANSSGLTFRRHEFLRFSDDEGGSPPHKRHKPDEYA